MKGRFLVAAGFALTALSACETSQPVTVQKGYISPHARGLLPYRQDLTKIVKGVEDGCYYEMMDGSTEGYLSPVLDPFHRGKPVCDPVIATE